VLVGRAGVAEGVTFNGRAAADDEEGIVIVPELLDQCGIERTEVVVASQVAGTVQGVQVKSTQTPIRPNWERRSTHQSHQLEAAGSGMVCQFVKGRFSSSSSQSPGLQSTCE